MVVWLALMVVLLMRLLAMYSTPSMMNVLGRVEPEEIDDVMLYAVEGGFLLLLVPEANRLFGVGSEDWPWGVCWELLEAL